MAQSLSGGCSCGAIRYRADTEPVFMLNCHCRDCQRATGSAYSPVVVVPKHAVEITGELRFHHVVGENGHGVERGFCPTCGSPIANKLDRMPEILGLLAGTLDDRTIHRPSVDMYVSSAASWDAMQPDTQKFAKGLAGP